VSEKSLHVSPIAHRSRGFDVEILFRSVFCVAGVEQVEPRRKIELAELAE